MPSSPYLSIVVVGRNDDYGGDFTKRLQRCITWNTQLLERHSILTEFIFVNWNPIPNCTTIYDRIQWPKNRAFVQYRILTVSPDLHQIFMEKNSKKDVPLHEYAAKNTGIRRAKGQYVLALNPDILISENIVKFIGKKSLNRNKYYKANRLDFKDDLNKPSKIWMKGFGYNLKNFNKLTYLFLKIRNEARCKWRIKSLQFEKIFNFLHWPVYYHNAEYQYHCNGGGDFMLMHQDSWLAIKGCPETTSIALHTDSLTAIMAACEGITEEIFSEVIYHQEHTRRFDAKEQGNPVNRKAYLNFQKEAQQMIMRKKATIYNDDDWGLSKFKLLEKNF